MADRHSCLNAYLCVTMFRLSTSTRDPTPPKTKIYPGNKIKMTAKTITIKTREKGKETKTKKKNGEKKSEVTE